MTKSMKNWWYYHKWYVICGVILLGIIIHLMGNALGLWKKKPDFQIAYVGKEALPSDTVHALENAFARADGIRGLHLDFNGDGEVLVQINQYLNSDSPDTDAAYYRMASEITLIGDVSDCESYFFLMDDPQKLQRDFHILANPDGSCPGDFDYSVGEKAISWADCPALTSLELGSYSNMLLGEETTGENQELLAKLFIGRRCFYTDTRTEHFEECSNLWDYMTRDYFTMQEE